MTSYTLDNTLDLGGVHPRGYLDMSFRELVSAFGAPLSTYGGNVRRRWTLLLPDASVITIYDWKNAGLDMATVTDWRVDGSSARAIDDLRLILEEKNALFEIHEESEDIIPELEDF